MPTQKEMQNSISWLLKQNLIQKEGKSIQTIEFGNALLEKGRSVSKTISGVCKKLTEELSAMGVDNTNAPPQ